MPWKVQAVSDQRAVLVHCVNALGMPVARAARSCGVSRTCAYKWIARARADPDARLEDRSRRPRVSPARTPAPVEALILERRDRFGWGARKIRADLAAHGAAVPSVRAVHAVLRRHQRIAVAPAPTPPPVAFERGAPNELWQMDFKGFIEIARRRYEQLTILDDHSRFLLALRTGADRTMNTAWDALWTLFGEVGLPDAILSDNAFGAQYTVPKTISRMDSLLIRLGIRPIHGRPYHPQTQGKVERLHGTFERELYPRTRRDCLEHFDHDCQAWRELYNTRRPHEAIGDRPPVTRWRPSPRRRPDRLPPVVYPADACIRRVSTVGDVRWKKYRLLAGRGLVGQDVAIEDHDHELIIRYANHTVRRIDKANLNLDTMQ